MLAGRQERLFNEAFAAYRNVESVLKDNGRNYMPANMDGTLSLAAIFDLQLQKKFIELSKKIEEEMTPVELEFLTGLFRNLDELEKNISGYRKFLRMPSFESFSNLSSDVINKLPDIPCLIMFALEEDNNQRDEYTSELFRDYMTILDCYISLTNSDSTLRMNLIRQEETDVEEYINKRNSHYQAIHNITKLEYCMNLQEDKTEESEAEETLEDLLEELDGMIGLDSVKKNVHELLDVLEVRKARKARGLSNTSMSLHLVFTGNPGTGKTTVARLIAKIYKKMGLLPRGQFIEADRSKLVGSYIGHTEKNTKEIIDKALGGVLFIDEAYALADGQGEKDFGHEVITVLLKAMEDYRDKFVVIVAGYSEKMDHFLDSNPGLRSRFNTMISFEDYSADEMIQIFNYLAKKDGFICTPSARKVLQEKMNTYCEAKTKDFANGRDVRNMFEKVVRNQHKRIISDVRPLEELSNEDLCELVGDDFGDIDI